LNISDLMHDISKTCKNYLLSAGTLNFSLHGTLFY